MSGVGRPLSVACLVAVTSVCGSGDGTGTPPPATAGEACVTLHQARASYSARCTGGTADDWLTNGESEDCATYDGYVADGRVVYDAAKFAGCLRQYTGTCQAGRYPSFCIRDVLAGQVAHGQPCPNTEVCAGIAVCITFGGPGTCAPTCFRLAAKGEPCGNQQCGPDLYCSAGTCVPSKGSGETCSVLAVPCRSAFVCDPDLQADPNAVVDPSATGTCKPLKEGGPCRYDWQCPARDFCQAGSCVRRRALGSPCADALTGCDSWSVCTNGSCVHAGGPGEPCAPNPFSTAEPICLTDARCDSNGRCPPIAAPGASCSGAVACVANYTCDATTQTCRTCEP